MLNVQRNGLTEGIWEERKRVYKLTEKDNRTTNTLLIASDKIKGVLANILKAQNTPYFSYELAAESKC